MRPEVQRSWKIHDQPTLVGERGVAAYEHSGDDLENSRWVT